MDRRRFLVGSSALVGATAVSPTSLTPEHVSAQDTHDTHDTHDAAQRTTSPGGTTARRRAPPSRSWRATACGSTSPTACPSPPRCTGTGSSSPTGWTACRAQPAPHPAGETYVYEFTLRTRDVHVPLAPRRDGADRARHGGHVHRAPARAARPARRPRLRHDDAGVAHRRRRARPDPNEMIDFNVLTFNGKSTPAPSPWWWGAASACASASATSARWTTTPSTCTGSTSRSPPPTGATSPSRAAPDTTVLVPVGSTRVIEFVPEEVSGDWAMHCHMTHHVMNQMGHGLPNMVGADTRHARPPHGRVLPST
jgi:hypothetical protein